MDNGFRVDFIGAGALRCATTWISQCLADHPQICFSSTKETLFFNRDYNLKKGVDFYKVFFKNCDEGKIKGEYTPSYYLDEEAAKRIKEFSPDVKIFLCLREPVDRSIDHYLYDKKKGMVSTPFAKLMKEGNSRYITDSFYYSHLSKFFKHFNPENVMVAIFEDINKDKEAFIKKIYKFAGVDENMMPDINSIGANSVGDVSYKFLFINKFINLRKDLKKNALGRIFICFLKAIGVNKIVKIILEANHSKNAGPADNSEIEDIKKLYGKELAKMYFDDIKKLEGLININLSDWYEKYK